MRNDNFWDKCVHGSIREKVAQFIDQSPLLSKYKGEQYYDLEDALVEFIENNRDLIAAEVDREYQRDDFVNQVEEDFGADAARIIPLIPIEKIDDVISTWQEAVNENDTIWSATWDDLTETLNDFPVVVGVEDYDEEAIVIYMAYLQEWYATHDPVGQDPACIDEFFNCDMEDKETAKHYRKLAAKFKKEHNL